ncbi:MAG: hypothetical protein DRR42_14750 [Gammaproteobacteria bacterium]|nr:MAG: hypothetical protein DRR42_14750 [Gammaproteobacteria bacterium]
MRLRNRQSYITTLPEGEPTENQAPKITRWVYFLILFSIVGYLTYIGYARLTQFHGRGQVEIEKTIISPNHGGQVISLPLKTGDFIQQGKVIARINSSANCQQKTTSRLDKLELDIQIKKSQLSLLKKKLSAEKGTIGHQDIRRALEIDRSYSKGSDRFITELSYKIDALNNEIILEDEALKKLKKESALISNGGCQDELIYAPFSATVTSISHRQHEFAHRGKPLITLIRENAPVQIEAFIENEYSIYASVDKEVEVVFPDGKSSRGVINEVMSSSAPFPTKVLKDYESVVSNIEILILPANKSEELIWRLYDRMEVQIRGIK